MCRAVSFQGLLDLDDPCLLEGGEGAILLDVAHALRADVDEDALSELHDEDAALLEVRLATHLSCRIELRSTGTVRVPPAYLGRLSCYCAFACHSSRMLAYISVLRQLPEEVAESRAMQGAGEVRV